MTAIETVVYRLICNAILKRGKTDNDLLLIATPKGSILGRDRVFAANTHEAYGKFVVGFTGRRAEKEEERFYYLIETRADGLLYAWQCPEKLRVRAGDRRSLPLPIDPSEELIPVSEVGIVPSASPALSRGPLGAGRRRDLAAAASRRGRPVAAAGRRPLRARRSAHA